MATTRKAATSTRKRTTARKTTKPAPQPVSEEEKQAMLEAYNVLKQADLPIPDELQVVDEWLTELRKQREAEAKAVQERVEAEQAELTEANRNGPWYVRNLYPAPFNLRLDRQTEKRRIELKPSGKPGDLHPLKDEDLNDPVLKQNVQLGIVEIIPAGVASRIIEKQTTNMGERVHVPLALLRNELQQPYKQGNVKVEAEFNEQGVTVAQLDPGLMQGHLSDRDVKMTGGMTRTRPGEAVQQAPTDQATSVVRSGFVPTGGNPAIIRQGGDNAHASMVDDLARRKNLQGPQAGLGDVQVVVEPVRKT